LAQAFRKEQIPNTANELSIRLSQVLALVFTNVDETDWDGFATWGDDKLSWEGRRGHRDVRSCLEGKIRFAFKY
jgi:hypothetical protein